MIVKNLILTAKIYKKLDPKPYEVNGKKGFTHQVIMDLGDSCLTVKLKEEVYNIVEVEKQYAFNVTVNTSAEYDSQRLSVGELVSDLSLDNTDSFALVSRNTYFSLENRNTTAPKPTKDKDGKETVN